MQIWSTRWRAEHSSGPERMNNPSLAVRKAKIVEETKEKKVAVTKAKEVFLSEQLKGIRI